MSVGDDAYIVLWADVGIRPYEKPSVPACRDTAPAVSVDALSVTLPILALPLGELAKIFDFCLRGFYVDTLSVTAFAVPPPP